MIREQWRSGLHYILSRELCYVIFNIMMIGGCNHPVVLYFDHSRNIYILC